MSLFDAFRLRPVIGIHRELRRLNDNIEAFMLHAEIPSKRDLLAAQHEAEQESARIDRDPSVLNTPSPAQRAADRLRAQAQARMVIDPEELLAVSEALQNEQDEGDAAW